MSIDNYSFTDDLLKEIKENRKGLHEILERIEDFRNNLNNLLPKNANDYRHRRLMEERMKTFTDIIKAELEVRKQIDSSVKSEFEVIKKSNSMEDDEKGYNIRDLAKAVESLYNNDEKNIFEESEVSE